MLDAILHGKISSSDEIESLDDARQLVELQD